MSAESLVLEGELTVPKDGGTALNGQAIADGGGGLAFDEEDTRLEQVLPLSTPAEILREMGRVYRRSKAGRTRIDTAGKYHYMLSTMMEAAKIVSLERRIEAMERELLLLSAAPEGGG